MSMDSIKDSLINAGKYVSENATLATTKANLKITLKSKTDVLTKEYASLGREYFNGLAKTEKKKYKTILELEEEIAKINHELNVLNETRVCQKCGTKVTKDINFCPECGSKVN